MKLFRVRTEVSAAIASGEPVVGLESTLISHGLPYPRNLEVAMEMEEQVRLAGALPATIGIVAGSVVVGLNAKEIESLATSTEVSKVSRRDVAAVVLTDGLGATTVAATAWAASRCGIPIMATGGIGGVHRGADRSFDISADLTQLAAVPVAVVCSGAKAILDLPGTLELLETLGVSVVGYGTDVFPAFYSRSSGLRLDYRVDSPDQAARLMRAHRDLAFESSLIFGNPVPVSDELPTFEVDSWISEALSGAEKQGISGKRVTPYLLGRLGDLSAGRTLEANIALLQNNALCAGRIAAAFAELEVSPRGS
jgi:pseudouridine-5'-phosphate glycosidase